MPQPVLEALEELTGDAVARWLEAARSGLAEARDEIDDLNVYPVPDGDTGTNLLLTVESACQEVQRSVAAGHRALRDVADAMARGALLGARGNSGVIVAQLLRGLADALADDGSPRALQRGLTRAAELSYLAVAAPVEGTVLTVARECAEAAAGVASSVLADVVRSACDGASASLARTPDLLPQLRAAGVVDAGGRGLCVLLEALRAVVTGETTASPSTAPQLLVPRDRSGLARAREQGSDAFAYEVQYLLHDTDDDAVGRLREVLGALGDSLVVVGAGDLWNVHVHVNDVGAAVEAGIEAGRPSRITVTRFADQVAASAPPALDRPASRTVVAVVPGEGLAALFTAAGAVVVDGGPTRNPSTGELLDAVHRTGGTEVVLLPNDGNTVAVATAAGREARDEGFTVAVVPTRSVLQGLAALAVCDPERAFADDVAAMAEAAGSTRWAGVTTAVREAMTSVGVCRPGDVLGLLEGDVVLIGADVEEVAVALVDRMLDGGGELVTVVSGADAPVGAADRLVAHVERTRPLAEVVAYEGGQPHYPLLLGVE